MTGFKGATLEGRAAAPRVDGDSSLTSQMEPSPLEEAPPMYSLAPTYVL